MLHRQISAEQLRAGRVAANLTQRQAAEQIGVDRNTISRWESGASAPQALALAAAVKLYGLEVEAELSDNVGRLLLMRIDRLETALWAVRDELSAIRNDDDVVPPEDDVVRDEPASEVASKPPS